MAAAHETAIAGLGTGLDQVRIVESKKSARLSRFITVGEPPGAY